MLEKLKEFIKKLNENGIPLPLARIDGKPTFTGTMSLLAFLTALLGQLGKISKFFGDIDLSQANYLLMICLGTYLGRKMQGDGKSGTLSAPEEKVVDNTKEIQ